MRRLSKEVLGAGLGFPELVKGEDEMLRTGTRQTHLKKMKSRWLCSVATWRLRKLGSWWNSDANMRPRRCPSRVSKLFSTNSGFALAALPCPWRRARTV